MIVAFVSVVLIAAQTANVEVEPVTCWWRTSAAAVRLGEPFTVLLTCSLLQTEAARVVADEERLAPSVVQLPPFEVLGGSRAPDVTTAARRFIQYEYRLRAAGENVFASEVAVPPVEVAYRVESRVSGGESLAGRDLTYVLPRLTTRVLSLVPDTAEDIREPPIATFAELEAVASRASLLRVMASIVFALGGLMLVLAMVGLMRRRRSSGASQARAVSGARILNAVRRELTGVRDEVRSSGWKSHHIPKVLAAIRLVAAYAAKRPVTQRRGPHAATGEVLVSNRPGPAMVVVSSAVTTTDDSELGYVMSRFAEAQYGRESNFDAGLDEALDTAINRADRLIAERPWMERVWPR
jgi:hypothetical protein